MLSKLLCAVLTYVAYECSCRRIEKSARQWNGSESAQRSDGERRQDLRAIAEVLLAVRPSSRLSDARIASTPSIVRQMHLQSPRSRRHILMQTAQNLDDQIAEEGSQDNALTDPGADSDLAGRPPAEEPEPSQFLNLRDVLNTKWEVWVYPREDGFMLFKDRIRKAEFTLLDDGTVVWGGDAGGLGTGGQWILREDDASSYLEVKRTTGFDIPGLRLPFGRDVWGADARIDLDDKLNFRLSGIIMSYNALYPASLIADWNATRLPGRFIRDTKDDDE